MYVATNESQLWLNHAVVYVTTVFFQLSNVAHSVGGKQPLIWIAQITQQLFECWAFCSAGVGLEARYNPLVVLIYY